jgi:hypothetical protein
VTPDRPVLPRDLAGTVAWVGVDPILEGRELQDALRRAIATRRGSCDWTVDRAGWGREASLTRGGNVLRLHARGSPRLAPGLADGAGARHRAVVG